MLVNNSAEWPRDLLYSTSDWELVSDLVCRRVCSVLVFFFEEDSLSGRESSSNESISRVSSTRWMKKWYALSWERGCESWKESFEKRVRVWLLCQGITNLKRIRIKNKKNLKKDNRK